MGEQNLRVQDLFSIGYVYLLILGLARDSIYYWFLDVNVLSYSGISDVLISPLAYLTRHPLQLLIFVLIIWWVLIQPKLHRDYKEQGWYKRFFQVEARDQRFGDSNVNTFGMLFLAIGIAAFFLGTGIGSGNKNAGRMERQEFTYDDVLHFSGEEPDTVRLMGINSSYVFYVRPEDKAVSISPVGSIERMYKLPETD